MVDPLDKADGLIITSKELEDLTENASVKMIPIKLAMQSDVKEDFFTR